MSGLSNVFGSGGGGSVGNIKTITGDTGGAVSPAIGGNINIIADKALLNCGSTVQIIGSPSFATLTLNVSDANYNTIIGEQSGKLSSIGSYNTSLGSLSFIDLTSGNENTAIGFQGLNTVTSGINNTAVGCFAGSAITTGGSNIAIGRSALLDLTTGSNNTIVGTGSTGSGSSYTSSESNNIILGPSSGTTGQSNEMWLGDFTNTTHTYVAGVSGTTVSNINAVTIDTVTGQLGSEAFPTGGVTLTGDSGGALGPSTSFTFNALSQAGPTISFSGSGTTMSLNTADGSDNIVIGPNSGTGGAANVGIGSYNFTGPTTGGYNIAIGQQSLRFVTSGEENTAIGVATLGGLSTGSNNTAIGFQAGNMYTTESNNISIGYTQGGTPGDAFVLRIGNGTGTSAGNLNAAYIAGIQGITVTGAAVLVSSSDQLGVAVSSRRFKDNIRDMDNYSSAILDLRPTVFNYKGSTETTGGLIAEEVAEIMPDLVVYDKQGDPQTVKYHELPALLLNELQRALKRIDALESKLGGCCGTR